MPDRIAGWLVESTPSETLFTQPPATNAWMFYAAIAFLWVGWLFQRSSGPWRALDLGIGWGLFLLSLLILSLALNRTVVRVSQHGIDRRTSPLPLLESSNCYPRAAIQSVHYWQAAQAARRLDQGPSKSSFRAGFVQPNGLAREALGGFTTEADAARAAQLLAARYGLTPSRLERANEPTAWRAIGYLLFLLISPLILARLASFATAFWQG
ncbi:MAG: hypothetical protein J0L64_22675 [Acidobacteria bacterium]|nr:hypothetical protein [Acidobacteriota bacterium]